MQPARVSGLKKITVLDIFFFLTDYAKMNCATTHRTTFEKNTPRKGHLFKEVFETLTPLFN